MEDERILSKFLLSLKNKWWLVVLAIAGIALVIWGGREESKKTTDKTTTQVTDTEEYRKKLEQDIKVLCSNIKGVGEVEVMVTLSEGEKKVYSGSQLISSEPPEVQGIAVLCEGGDNIEVKAEITRMLCSLFDIGSHRVYVGKRTLKNSS